MPPALLLVLLLAPGRALGWPLGPQDSSPLLLLGDQLRQRHLWAPGRRAGLYLELRADGTAGGALEQTAQSLLELRSLSSEVTVIQGVHTSLYLCMDELGHLRGQRTFSEADCTFTELVLPDGYSLFLSVRHGRAVSLQPARRAQLPPGKRLPPLSQFLPVISRLPPGEEILGYEDLSFPELKLHRNPLDLDSGDPFGSGLELANALLSPAFFSRK